MNKPKKLSFKVVLATLAFLAPFVCIGWLAFSEPPISIGMVNHEQVIVRGSDFVSDKSITVTVKNTGSMSVTIESATLWFGYRDWKETNVHVSNESAIVIPKGSSANYIFTLKEGYQFVAGEQYQILLLTTKGNDIVYTATYNPTI